MCRLVGPCADRAYVGPSEMAVAGYGLCSGIILTLGDLPPDRRSVGGI